MTRLLLLVLPLAACAGTQKPVCSDAALVAIESSYVAEVLTSCSGYKSKDECPRYEEIRDRWEQKRQEWIKCQ